MSLVILTRPRITFSWTFTSRLDKQNFELYRQQCVHFKLFVFTTHGWKPKHPNFSSLVCHLFYCRCFFVQISESTAPREYSSTMLQGPSSLVSAHLTVEFPLVYITWNSPHAKKVSFIIEIGVFNSPDKLLSINSAFCGRSRKFQKARKILQSGRIPFFNLLTLAVYILPIFMLFFRD